MNFRAKINLNDAKFPGRLYLHNYGIEVFGSNPIPTAKNEYRACLNKIGGDYLWVIGILWGDDIPNSVVEIFAYNNIEKKIWPGNPEVDYFQFRSRFLIDKPRYLTCGDGLMILGREEEFRRHIKSLEVYLNSGPRFSSGIDEYL